MIKIQPTFALPEGYELHEDTTGLYLITDDQIIGIFTHCATPANIQKAIIDHQCGR